MAKKIVIVDDDISLLEAVELVFQMEGYTVYTCTNGSKAHEIITTVKPDIIILDVLLSGEDGRDVARCLKKSTDIGTIPIVMFSANPNIRDSAIASGANEFISKPFDIQELLSVTERLN